MELVIDTVPPPTRERASLRDGRLSFSTPGGLDKALADGCFYLRIPDDFDLAPAIRLSKEFYRSADGVDGTLRAYRGFKEKAGVYFDREHFQTEHVLIDQVGRAEHFPAELVATCDRMHGTAIEVLRAVLRHLGIPEKDWAEITGGGAENRGTNWFASSHYRPERDQVGCAPHKDTGFITVLYIEEDGLEASVGGRWVPVPAVPGYFIINFGASFEILTRRSARPVRAILHRVRKTLPSPRGDRFSFAAFVNPPATGVLFELDTAGVATPWKSVEAFLVEFNAETWNDRHDDFGIR